MAVTFWSAATAMLICSGIFGAQILCVRVRLDTRHLNFAILERPLGAFGPRRLAVELEVASPQRRRLAVSFEPLQEQREVEDGISVARIGVERAPLAFGGLGKTASIVEEISKVVPGRGEARVRLDGCSISRLRLHR